MVITKEVASRWLPLMIALLALAVTWGVQKESLENLEEAMKEHNTILTTHDNRIDDLESQYSAFDTDIEWIKTSLLRIEAELTKDE